MGGQRLPALTQARRKDTVDRISRFQGLTVTEAGVHDLLPAPVQDGSGQRTIARPTLAFAPTRRAAPGAGSGFTGEAGAGRTWPDARRPSGGGV